MNVRLIDTEGTTRLLFEGHLTFEFARELEDRIIDALRRHAQLEVDLSGVVEIDVCGLHLLRILDAVGGDGIRTVATSPAVEQARLRLMAPGRGSSLRSARRQAAESDTAAPFPA